MKNKTPSNFPAPSLLVLLALALLFPAFARASGTNGVLIADTVRADEVRTREISAPDPSPPSNVVTVASSLNISGGLTVSNDAVFLSGIRYIKPLGDLSQGIYTNAAPNP